MSTYIELPIANIELDKSNPRIARGVAYYGENITSETMALLLGSTSEACASLRESIRENGGIIHPIVVNKRSDNSYVVIEGTMCGFDKSDFAHWMVDNRFSILQDVRRLPEILKSKKALEVFLKENSREAKKILAVEEITTDKLKDVPYELLAQELAKRMAKIELREVEHLRDDSEYSEKLESLERVFGELEFVLDEVKGE